MRTWLLAFPLATLVLAVACDDSTGGPAGVGGPANVDGGTTPGSQGDASPDSGSTVLGDSEIVQLTAGAYVACVRRKNGSVWCWGRNTFGELGRGVTSTMPGTAAAVQGLNDAVDVSAGEAHVCAVHATGAVSCWGLNAKSQLGDGTNDNGVKYLAPHPVLDTVTGQAFNDGAAIRAFGAGNNCILRKSGAVVCWAGDNIGVTGDGTVTVRDAPGANVSGITDAIDIAKGDSQACARLSGGGVRCWGANSAGQCGNGTMGTSEQTPITPTEMTDVVEFALGQAHACWRQSTGKVRCVGRNNAHQSGNGNAADSPLATDVTGLTDAVQISGSDSHTCAVRSNGHVACWGLNNAGQLGDGTKEKRMTPVEVAGVEGAKLVAAGRNFTCILRTSNQVVCLGDNQGGALGDGTETLRVTVAPVAGL